MSVPFNAANSNQPSARTESKAGILATSSPATRTVQVIKGSPSRSSYSTVQIVLSPAVAVVDWQRQKTLPAAERPLSIEDPSVKL